MERFAGGPVISPGLDPQTIGCRERSDFDSVQDRGVDAADAGSTTLR